MIINYTATIVLGGEAAAFAPTLDSIIEQLYTTLIVITVSLIHFFEIMWIKFHTVMDFVLGVCYHPPKPMYNTAELAAKISSDLEYINIHNSDAVIVFAGDLNSLPTDFLTQDYGLTLINDTITHGSRILDKFFTSRPDLFVSRTIASTINTKHKAVIIGSADVVNSVTPLNASASYKITKRCFDIRAPNINRLQNELDSYNWNSLLQEDDVCKLYCDLTKVLSFLLISAFLQKLLNFLQQLLIS